MNGSASSLVVVVVVVNVMNMPISCYSTNANAMLARCVPLAMMSNSSNK